MPTHNLFLAYFLLASNIVPAIQNFTGANGGPAAISGDTWPGLIIDLTQSGSPMNLTGTREIAFSLYFGRYSTEALSLTYSAGQITIASPATLGRFTILPTPLLEPDHSTPIPPQDYWYRCVVTSSTGQKTTFFEGIFTVGA